MKVVGDTNGVAIAQEVHESILFSLGCLNEKHMVWYDTAIPISDLYEFAYVDGHHVSHVLPKSCLHCSPNHSVGCRLAEHDRGVLPDTILIDNSVEGYERHGAARNVDKQYRYAQSYGALGSKVEGERGSVWGLPRQATTNSSASRFLFAARRH